MRRIIIVIIFLQILAPVFSQADEADLAKATRYPVAGVLLNKGWTFGDIGETNFSSSIL